MTAMRPTLRAIDTMHEAAKELAERAESRDMRKTARQIRKIARTLDATRAALLVEGPDYLEAASAIVHASADRLTTHAIWIGHCADRDSGRLTHASARA